MMNTVIYDSRRIFFPTGSGGSGGSSSADKVSVDIKSETEISSVQNVQAALQYLADHINGSIGDLPNELEPDTAKLKDVIKGFNDLLKALKGLDSSGGTP